MKLAGMEVKSSERMVLAESVRLHTYRDVQGSVVRVDVAISNLPILSTRGFQDCQASAVNCPSGCRQIMVSCRQA